jgi:hypothetical protein
VARTFVIVGFTPPHAEERPMVTITCPWCEEEALLPWPELEEPEASFTCLDCGTTVTFVEEPVVLDLAA